MSLLIKYSSPAGSYILPQGYIRLAYIESTGTQWVDSRWKPNQNTSAYLQIQITDITKGTDIFGAYTADNRFELYRYNSYLEPGFYKSCNNKKIPIDTKLHTWFFNKNVFKQDGENTITFTSGTFQGQSNIYVGAMSRSAGNQKSFPPQKIYFCRLWNGDTIIRDMVPVQTISTITSADGTSCPSGSIGLLDLVENKFYQNKGTGTFIAGPEIPQGFPTSEYCQVETHSAVTQTSDVIPCYRRSDGKPGKYTLSTNTFTEVQGTIGPSITFGWGEVINGAVGFPQTSAYDSNIYYEPDGSAWIRVFHHNNPANNKFSSSDTFTTSFKKNDNMWWDMPKFNQITDNIYDIMVKYKTTSNAGEIKHRWVQYTNPMSSTFENTTYYKVTKSYYYGSTIMKNSYGGFYRDISNNAYIVQNNNNRNHWYGAIGCWNAYNNGIPGPNYKVITSGYVDVYMHIPNHPAIPHNISSGDGRNGEKNGAFHFDGTSYMEVDAGSILPANCTKYTIMMWAKVDTSGVCTLFSQRNQLRSTGRCVLYDNTMMYYDDGVRNYFSPGVTRNNWNHYAFVRNGSNKYVYVNGQLVNTSSASTAEVFSPVLTIGACQIIDSGVMNQFVGDMKDIKVFDTNLDASGIQQEM